MEWINALRVAVRRIATLTPNVLVPISVLSVLSGCVVYDARKADWDQKITEMCEKDGGVQIYEKVNISADEAKLLPHVSGKLSATIKRLADLNAPVITEEVRTHLHDSAPEVWRTEVTFIRRSDNKVVARRVTYSRRGGDFPSIAHDSYFGCPDPELNTFQLGHLFIIDGVQQ